MTPFSIITSIYKNDKPEFVRVSLDSMLINQTIKPTEINIMMSIINLIMVNYSMRY